MKSGILLHETPFNQNSTFVTVSEYHPPESARNPHTSKKENLHLFSNSTDFIILTLYADIGINNLITGITLPLKGTGLDLSSFKFLDIEVFNNETEKWTQMIGVQKKGMELPLLLDGDSVEITGCGIAQFLRVSFLAPHITIKEMKVHSDNGKDIQEIEDSMNSNLKEQEEQWKAFLSIYFKSMQIYGYNLYIVPDALEAMNLLNLINVFKKSSKLEQATETEILFGLALLNAGRSVQAAEVLRKASNYFVNKHEHQSILKGKDSSDNILNGSLSSRRTYKKEFAINSSLLNNNVNTISPFLLRAARIEILISDALFQHSMLASKVEALQRATEYFQGKRYHTVGDLGHNNDASTKLLRLCPVLCRLLVKCLGDKVQPLRIAAIRSIEFLIKFLGSNMNPHIPLILKSLLQTYPNSNVESTSSTVSSRPFGNQLDKEKAGVKVQNLVKNNVNNNELEKEGLSQDVHLDQASLHAAADFYNHMIEKIYENLVNLSGDTLNTVFQDIILPNLFTNTSGNISLKSLYFKLAERIINLCEGDLSIDVVFVQGHLAELMDNKTSFRFNLQKLWEMVKNKLILNMKDSHINKFVEWIAESLENLVDSEVRNDSVMYYFQQLLDLTLIICRREKSKSNKTLSLSRSVQIQMKNFYFRTPNQLKSLVSPLIKWLDDIMVNETSSIDLFRKLWTVLNDLVDCISPVNEINLTQIAVPILNRILKACEEASPTTNILEVLMIIFPTIKVLTESLVSFLKDFMPVFMACIPNNIYEKAFEVFDLLVKLAYPFLDEYLMKYCIEALLDQYTIKSQAYKQSKESFLQTITKKDEKYAKNIHRNMLYNTLKICLIDNPEPLESIQQSTTQAYSSQRSIPGTSRSTRIKGHPFDSKQFTRSYDDFQNKLDFAEQVCHQAGADNFASIYLLVSERSFQIVLEKLICSGNSCVRIKGMEILKTITNMFLTAKDLKIASVHDDKESLKLREDMSINLQADFEFIADDKLDGLFTTLKVVFCRFVLPILKLAFQQSHDLNVQFYALAMLNSIFEHFLPSCSSTEELELFIHPKKVDESPKIEIFEFEHINSFEEFHISYSDEVYSHYRLKYILAFWPSVQSLSQSSWSSAKNLALLLICRWVKLDPTCYLSSLQISFKSDVFSLLMNLLTSGDSEMRYWGLMILGSLCGMSNIVDCAEDRLLDYLTFFQRLANSIPLALWETAYNLQDDWNSTIKEAAILLIQLVAPRESIYNFYHIKKEAYNLKHSSQAQNLQNITIEFTTKLNSNIPSQFSTYRERKTVNNNYNIHEELRRIGLKSPSSKRDTPNKFSDYGNFLDRSPNLPDFAVSQIYEDNNRLFESRNFKGAIEEDELKDLFWLTDSSIELIKEALNLFQPALKFKQNYWDDKLNQIWQQNVSINQKPDDMDMKMFGEADEFNEVEVFEPADMHKLMEKGLPDEIQGDEIDMKELEIFKPEDNVYLADFAANQNQVFSMLSKVDNEIIHISPVEMDEKEDTPAIAKGGQLNFVRSELERLLRDTDNDLDENAGSKVVVVENVDLNMGPIRGNMLPLTPPIGPKRRTNSPEDIKDLQKLEELHEGRLSIESDEDEIVISRTREGTGFDNKSISPPNSPLIDRHHSFGEGREEPIASLNVEDKLMEELKQFQEEPLESYSEEDKADSEIILPEMGSPNTKEVIGQLQDGEKFMIVHQNSLESMKSDGGDSAEEEVQESMKKKVKEENVLQPRNSINYEPTEEDFSFSQPMNLIMPAMFKNIKTQHPGGKEGLVKIQEQVVAEMKHDIIENKTTTTKEIKEVETMMPPMPKTKSEKTFTLVPINSTKKQNPTKALNLSSSKKSMFISPRVNTTSPLTDKRTPGADESGERSHRKSQNFFTGVSPVFHSKISPRQNLRLAEKVKEKLKEKASWDRLHDTEPSESSDFVSKSQILHQTPKEGKVVRKRSNLGLHHENKSTHFSPDPQTSQTLRPSPRKRVNIMSTILRKADSNFKMEQARLNMSLNPDRIGKDSVVLHESGDNDMNLASGFLNCLTKVKDKRKNRSTSAGKKGLKNLDKTNSSGNSQSSKSTKLSPKEKEGKMSNKKGAKHHKGKEKSCFVPKRPTLFRNNLSSSEYGFDLFEDNNNKSL